MYFSVLYCFLIYKGENGGYVGETDLKVYGYTSISGERDKHWNYILEYNIKDK